MKKRFELTLKDVTLIEITDVFITLWIVGLFLVISPLRTIELLVKWKWGFFALAIIVGIKPLWGMLGREHGISKEAQPKTTKRKASKK